MTPNDIANMADFIAQAIHKAAAGEDESWGDLAGEEQDQFRLIAHAAMGAHDAWLAVNKYRIVKPGPKGGKIKQAGLIGLNGQPLAVKH